MMLFCKKKRLPIMESILASLPGKWLYVQKFCETLAGKFPRCRAPFKFLISPGCEEEDLEKASVNARVSRHRRGAGETRVPSVPQRARQGHPSTPLYLPPQPERLPRITGHFGCLKYRYVANPSHLHRFLSGQNENRTFILQ